MQLLIVRHAKSSWKESGLSDFARPLNDRGKRNLPEMARRLRRLGLKPDWIFASDSQRTRATAQFLANELGVPQDLLQFDHRLYLATGSTLMDVARETPPSARCVMLVGHNPGLTEFTNCLLPSPLERELPTLAVAQVQCAICHWPQLRKNCGELRALYWPKQLPSADLPG